MGKKFGFLLISILVAFSLAAQEVKDTSIDTIGIVGLIEYESMPIFEGDLIEFINSNLIYPTSALRDSIEGKIFVSFLVDTLGNTINHCIINEIRNDLHEEALRVTRLIQFEKPAMKNGKPAKIKYIIPVEFKLSKAKNRTKN